MQAELVRIGNSRGIRIPKALIEQCGLGTVVRLSINKGRLIIAPDRSPRQGWEESFRSAGIPAKNQLILGSLPPNRFDAEEWEW